MQRLKFSEIFSQRRKSLRLTQQDIAQYVGVTSAAVSKWEQGSSYPELTILPKIATLLDLTIDALLGYESQLTRQRIQEIYSQFAVRLSSEAFEDVEPDIDNMLKEYYSCFPFVLNMAQLYLNYHMKAKDKNQVFQRIEQLCERVMTHCDDYKQLNDARMIHAFTLLASNKPQQLIEFLGEDIPVQNGIEQLIATARMMLGETDKAKTILQVSVFQSVMLAMSSITESLMLETGRHDYFDKVVERGIGLMSLFDLAKLNANMAVIFYYKAATGYMMQQRTDKAMLMLEGYYKSCLEFKFPYIIKGDQYFDSIDEWITESSQCSGTQPRDDHSIKQDMLSSLTDSPLFGPLQQEEKYKAIVANLKHHLRV